MKEVSNRKIMCTFFLYEKTQFIFDHSFNYFIFIRKCIHKRNCHFHSSLRRASGLCQLSKTREEWHAFLACIEMTISIAFNTYGTQHRACSNPNLTINSYFVSLLAATLSKKLEHRFYALRVSSASSNLNEIQSLDTKILCLWNILLKIFILYIALAVLMLMSTMMSKSWFKSNLIFYID